MGLAGMLEEISNSEGEGKIHATKLKCTILICTLVLGQSKCQTIRLQKGKSSTEGVFFFFFLSSIKNLLYVFGLKKNIIFLSNVVGFAGQLASTVCVVFAFLFYFLQCHNVCVACPAAALLYVAGSPLSMGRYSHTSQ